MTGFSLSCNLVTIVPSHVELGVRYVDTRISVLSLCDAVLVIVENVVERDTVSDSTLVDLPSKMGW